MALLPAFWKQVIPAALCATVFGLCMSVFFQEYRVTLALGGNAKRVVTSLTEESADSLFPRSPRSTRDMLAACGDSLTLTPMLKADPVKKAQVASNCRKIAARILETAPSNSRALAVTLLTADTIDAATFAAAQRSAPFEPWPLNIRLQAVAEKANPSDDVLEIMKADIISALQMPWGRPVVARIYRRQAELRETITAAAETLSPQDQKAFLNAVRKPDIRLLQ